MSIVAQSPAQVIGGVDTHKHVHVATVIARLGELLAVESFLTNHAGYRRLVSWLRSHGEVLRAGVEDTGTCGAGLARSALSQLCNVESVIPNDRGDLDNRPFRGSDQFDGFTPELRRVLRWAALRGLLPRGTPQNPVSTRRGQPHYASRARG